MFMISLSQYRLGSAALPQAATLTRTPYRIRPTGPRPHAARPSKSTGPEAHRRRRDATWTCCHHRQARRRIGPAMQYMLRAARSRKKEHARLQAGQPRNTEALASVERSTDACEGSSEVVVQLVVLIVVHVIADDRTHGDRALERGEQRRVVLIPESQPKKVTNKAHAKGVGAAVRLTRTRRGRRRQQWKAHRPGPAEASPAACETCTNEGE